MARKVLVVSDGAINEKTIGDELEDLQGEVDGYIQTTYFGEKLAERKISLIFNEDGKMIGLPPTIALVEDGELIDVIVGNVVICSSDATSFGSINESQKDFIKKELAPALFTNGQIGFVFNV
ncbi:MAG: DUF3846 domain-containing protein [Lachnospiraceae bacterium]|nr:DUF3846 domain-containing protein [Lachnospiraceae bacterium]